MKRKSTRRHKVRNSNKRFLIFISSIALVFSIYFVYTFVEQSFRMTGINAEINTKKAQLDEINGEIQSLESELEQVNDIEFIEKIARQKLKMVKPRDIIYVDSDKPMEENGISENSND